MTHAELDYIHKAQAILLDPRESINIRAKVARIVSQIYARHAAELELEIIEQEMVDRMAKPVYNTNLT